MTKKEKRLLHEIISKQCKERGLEVDPDSINEKTDFIEDLGLDSLDLVEIVISLEATLGQTFDFDINDFMVVKDMGDVYNFIDNFKEKLKQKLEEEARISSMSDEERIDYKYLIWQHIIQNLSNYINKYHYSHPNNIQKSFSYISKFFSNSDNLFQILLSSVIVVQLCKNNAKPP